MKINNGVYVEQETIGGEFKEISSAIRQEDLGMALRAVSKNLYSNPIGSFIRELVSNGVDANVDNEVSELVKVNIFKEEGTWYFQVTDEGKGMNPEVFEKVYMNWFNSDKRDTNDKIGGWGVGSKSPLSYVDNFELTTIADGFKYEYAIIDQSPAPTATLLNVTPTAKPSGTVVKVEIQEKDLWDVHLECKQQLTYFNNVVVINDSYYYNNSFKVFEGDFNGIKFKVRDGDFPFGNEMHIVLGQVAYPIDWNLLGITRVECPVGIVFETGELPVTLSRESINYNADVITDGVISKFDKRIITDRIEKVYEGLKDKFYEDFITTDIFKFIDLWYSDKKSIEFPTFTLPFKLRNNGRISPIFVHNGNKYHIQKQHTELIFDNFRSTELIKGKTGVLNAGRVTKEMIIRGNAVFAEEGDNHWANQFYVNADVIRSRKITYSRVKTTVKLLGLSRDVPRNGKIVSISETGSIKKAYNFLKYLTSTIKGKLESYDNIPQEYIDNEKLKQKLLEEERKGNISYYDLSNKRTTTSFEGLLNNYDFLFYMDKEKANDKDIVAYNALFKKLPNGHDTRVKFLLVSTTTIKKIKKQKTVRPVEDIFKYKKLQGFFNTFKYAKRYQRIFKPSYISSISSYYNILFNRLDNYITFDTYASSVVRCTTDTINSNEEISYSFCLVEHFKEQFADKTQEIYKIYSILDELEPVYLSLRRLAEMVQSGSYHLSKLELVKLRDFVKHHKLRKLKSKFYGN